MWVPIVENGEYNSDGADYFVKKELEALLHENPNIDALLLGCTHYQKRAGLACAQAAPWRYRRPVPDGSPNHGGWQNALCAI